MAKESLKTVANIMKGLDLCMFTTVDSRGSQTSRPMSNNGDVAYEGTSYFFTYQNSKKVRQIKKNSRVGLHFENLRTIGKNVFIHVAGEAKIETDREILSQHWVPSLKLYFPQGLDTKGIALIAVKAKSIHFWIGKKEGMYSLVK
jgi:general stress protein 26